MEKPMYENDFELKIGFRNINGFSEGNSYNIQVEN